MQQNLTLKVALFFCLINFLVIVLRAQEKIIPGVENKGPGLAADTGRLYTVTEIRPQFPGGNEAWKKFLMNTIRTPEPSKENGLKPGIYRVMIRFIVNKDGSLDEIAAESKAGFGLEEEGVRVIKRSPKWIPGKQNGRFVRTIYRQPITFSIQ